MMVRDPPPGQFMQLKKLPGLHGIAHTHTILVAQFDTSFLLHQRCTRVFATLYYILYVVVEGFFFLNNCSIYFLLKSIKLNLLISFSIQEA